MSMKTMSFLQKNPTKRRLFYERDLTIWLAYYMMPPTQNVVYECDTLTLRHVNESRHARRMSPSFVTLVWSSSMWRVHLSRVLPCDAHQRTSYFDCGSRARIYNVVVCCSNLFQYYDPIV